MKFGKFQNIFRSFKRKSMKGMIPEYSKQGIIEEEFCEMEPYLEKAFELGRLSEKRGLAK
jgi:hypothetical protein